MTEKLVNFRFDVDTELCLRRGMPNLLSLAANFGVRFTFFVNPGRAIRRRDVFSPRAGGRLAEDKLSLTAKMSLPEIAWLLLFNPRTLPRHCRVLRQAEESGHELGLHGGRNHGDWARNVRGWTSDRILDEIGYGTEAMEACGVQRPRAFASPGWATTPELPRILSESGFGILADTHGKQRPVMFDSATGITLINTELCGEPYGAGYLESGRAAGLSDEDIEQTFRKRLDTGPSFICIYDHPFFAGIRKFDLLERLVSAVIDSGRSVVTLRQVADFKT